MMPAVAVADDDRALDPELTQQLDRVLGHVVVVERAIDESAVRPCPICSGAITRNCGMKNGIHFSGIDPAPTVEKEQRRPFPVDLVVHVQTVDRCVGQVGSA